MFVDDEGVSNEMDNLPSDVTSEDREVYKRVREKALEVRFQFYVLFLVCLSDLRLKCSTVLCLFNPCVYETPMF